MWRITGYSFTIPLAPRMSRASRAVSRAAATFARLASETCSGRIVPASFIRPSRQARSCPLVISVSMWTSFCWTSWYRAVELAALLRVAECGQIAGARRPERAPGDAVAGLVETRERTAEPLGAREEAPRRHADVLQHELRGDRGAQRELPLDVVRREAGRAPLDQEAADRVAVLRPDDGQVGDRAVRDPSFRTGQDPGGAVAARPGLHAAGVGAVIRLGEAEAADHPAGGHPGQPAPLLLLAAPSPDGVHRERALHGAHRAQARVARLELLHHEPVGDVREAGAAVALKVRSEHAERGQAQDEIPWKLLARMQGPSRHYWLATGSGRPYESP